ncbi:MAG: tetratricopeptide repeat protein [Acidobacteriota bacterium]
MLDLEEEKYAAAEIGFRRVIAADAHRTPAYLNLGKALRGLAKTEEAARVLARFKELEAFDAEVAELRSAARRNPDKAGVYLRLGRLYLQGGRRQQAREMLEKALRIDPDLDAARQQLAKLQRQGSASGPSR